VGIEPRMKYNAQHLLFEWALNEWFGTTFVNVPGNSDIFIDAATADLGAFYVGLTETESSYVVFDEPEATAFIQALNLTTAGISFTINVPIAVANALTTETANTVPNISQNRENIIRQIADLYNYAGITYNVITY
jgi:cellulase/cellobiase CelA1